MNPEDLQENSPQTEAVQNQGLKEVVEIHWPMYIPKRATFAVSAPQPIQIAAPYSMQIHSNSPIHIICDSKLKVSPAGPATPGFARGWLKLPTELKLQILRHNLTCPSAIWPSNINTVTRRELFPYLRMTPDIATLAKYVFYQENRFIMQFSSSNPHTMSVLARPCMVIRPQLRRVTFLTRLTAPDWELLQAMSTGQHAGFTGLIHLEVRCLSWEAAASLNILKPSTPGSELQSFEKEYLARRGEPLHFPFNGVVTYDRSGCVTTGTQELDDACWSRSHRIEEYVTRDIKFTK